MSEPGWFMRFMVLASQGVFFNLFFIAYVLSPRTCHRFVGYLEEEAVLTYTREIADIDAGKLPMWSKMEAPDIAVQYPHDGILRSFPVCSAHIPDLRVGSYGVFVFEEHRVLFLNGDARIDIGEVAKEALENRECGIGA